MGWELAVIFIGGCAGGIIRYILAVLLPAPLGTYTANVVGCIVVGVIISQPQWALVGVGVGGALSTWSTLSKELGTMLTAREYRRFFGYLAASVCTGVCAIIAGELVGTFVFPSL